MGRRRCCLVVVTLCVKAEPLLTLLCATFVAMARAQHHNHSLWNVPEEELMPLAAAYGLALDSYAAGNWTESIRFFDLSLRLHRLARDSARHCALRCGRGEPPPFTAGPELRARWQLVREASCQRRCRARLPALRLPPPGARLREEFSSRTPYRYLHSAHSHLNDLQSAVPCAYTFLQRNPEDQEMLQLMQEYKKEYDLSGFLIDYEEHPYEASFVRGVKQVGLGEYSNSVEHLEEALRLYLQEYHLCQADCEGIGHFSPDRDFYTVIAEVYVDILKCQLKCEKNLMPNVGGYFVENFLPTIYHYLQYAYYKLNDGRKAVPCAYSYSLFDPEDQLMKQNLLYYKVYSQQWGLQSGHFKPRVEAFKLYNQTMAQKEMLTLTEMYLELNDEDISGPEQVAVMASESPDAEFEGVGDYEESIRADWSQTKGKGDAGKSDI
ncbi:endoplasmic reticulum protein SC65-like [Menidia menidia]